jgi:hypothetical protein
MCQFLRQRSALLRPVPGLRRDRRGKRVPENFRPYDFGEDGYFEEWMMAAGPADSATG